MAAYADLAKAHARLFRIYESGDRKQKHHADLAWRNHWDALECTGDATSKLLLCREFNIILSGYRLHDEFTSHDSEQIECASTAGCACLKRTETYDERENSDAKQFRSASP